MYDVFELEVRGGEVEEEEEEEEEGEGDIYWCLWSILSSRVVELVG